MKRRIIIALFLALAALGTFLWHHQQPTQKINRTVDQLFDTVAHQKLLAPDSLEVKKSLREVFADEIAIAAIDRFPGGTLSFEEAFKYLKTFQDFTSLCEFSEKERSLAINGNQAQAFRTATVVIASGPKSRSETDYHFTFDLEKTDRWRITAIRADPVSP